MMGFALPTWNNTQGNRCIGYTVLTFLTAGETPWVKPAELGENAWISLVFSILDTPRSSIIHCLVFYCNRTQLQAR